MTTEQHDDDLDADLGQAEPYRDGRVHVMAEKCSTCVFRPGNPMSLRPGQLKDLTDHVQETGVPFSCHQTLPYAGAEHIAFYGGAALCAGAVANYAAGSPQMQLALAMDVVTYVDPAPAHVGKLAPPDAVGAVGAAEQQARADHESGACRDSEWSCSYCEAEAATTACEWFAWCERDAAGVVVHPILGEVPTCQICADRLDLDLDPRP